MQRTGIGGGREMADVLLWDETWCTKGMNIPETPGVWLALQVGIQTQEDRYQREEVLQKPFFFADQLQTWSCSPWFWPLFQDPNPNLNQHQNPQRRSLRLRPESANSALDSRPSIRRSLSYQKWSSWYSVYSPEAKQLIWDRLWC